jgi:quercetin dioxygenase-like cupin family protein
MDTTELENANGPKKDTEVAKGAAHIIVELIEYEHNAVVSKSIMKRATGSINAMSFDTGEGLNEKTSPFDTYAQIIDGTAIIVVAGKETKLETGEGIVIPAHKPNHVKPNGRFKMLLTVIKSGYED